MIINEPVTITTDYMQSDLHIVAVTPTEIFPEQKYVMCDIYADNGEHYQGVCYWYDGDLKDIPFTLTKTQITKLLQ